MTKLELEQLSDMIAEKSKHHPPVCVAFNVEDIAAIKALATAYMGGQKTFRMAIVSILVLGSVVIFCIGLFEYVKKILENMK